MSYQVLARKWRPQKFADILGQRHITLTLQNAIKKNRVAHAYLFVGPRGIGKTTTARILAKALNCPTPRIDDRGYVEPCCECDTCRETTTGNCLDVIEIDGASHNKVDDIRELRENVLYTPTHGRKYKIFIIDEVHMLTTAAWNALLKTLEEPPPHIKFLFATTEAHKVLPTIVSRCQRFDLKRIATPIIVSHLRTIAQNEGINIEDGALEIIARAADGGMRDSQSILDQMIAFCGGLSSDSSSGLITESEVIEVFGLTSATQIRGLAMAMIANHAPEVITLIHHLADQGRSLEYLYADLLMVFRNLLIMNHVDKPQSILEISSSDYQEYEKLADVCSVDLTQKLVEGLMMYENEMRNYLNKRLFLEVTLLRVMRDAHAPSLNAVINKLKRLKESSPDETSPPSSPATAVQSPPRFSPDHDRQVEVKPVEVASVSPLSAGPVTAPVPNRVIIDPPLPTTPPVSPLPKSEPAKDISLTHYDHPKTPVFGEIRETSSAVDTEEQRQEALKLWQILTEEIGKLPGRMTLQFHMREAVPLSYKEGILKVGISDDFPEEHATEMRGFDINQTLKRCLSRITKIEQPEIILEKVSENFGLKTKTAICRTMTANSTVWQAMKKNEFVQGICHLFNGEVVDVRG